jgi:CMP-N,N'-diacetyllegionaminic acid synthase
MMMSNLAIIPARSGSKGIIDKNIRDLCGKPLMAHTIDAALMSGCFDEVMVSTDSEKYAEIAKQYGANVPFLRSSRTATDKASTWDMVEEVLEAYKRRGMNFDSLCIIQPTSPIRNAKDIQEAYKIYNTIASFAVVSVCEAEHSPLWCGHLPENQEFINFIDKESMRQRQSGEKFYRLNGAIYIVNTNRFCENRFLYQKGSFAYIMPQDRSVDIDTEIDFKLAEIIRGGITGLNIFIDSRTTTSYCNTVVPLRRRCA